MAHDSSDRLTGIAYPDGTHVSYGYDARSRPRRIDSPQLGVVVADQTYTAAGLRAHTTFGNGVLTTRAYDPRLRPSTITIHPPDNGPPFLDYRYRYDGASNVLAITDQRPTAVRAQRFDNSQQFTYDDLYRLTGAVYDTGRLSLAYDRIGNLIERRFVAVPGTAVGPPMPGRIRHGGSAGASDRIGRSADAPGPQAPSGDETGRAYTYDANGNLTRLGDMTLTWGFQGPLGGRRAFGGSGRIRLRLHPAGASSSGFCRDPRRSVARRSKRITYPDTSRSWTGRRSVTCSTARRGWRGRRKAVTWCFTTRIWSPPPMR